MFLLLTTITDLFILYRENYTGKYEICIYIYILCICWCLFFFVLALEHNQIPGMFVDHFSGCGSPSGVVDCYLNFIGLIISPKKDNIFWGCSVGIWWLTLRRLKKTWGYVCFFRNLLKVVDFLDDILSDQSLLKGGAWGLNRQVVEITWLFVGFMVHIWGFHKWGYPKNIQKHRGPRPCRTFLLIWLVTQKT